MTMVHEHGPLRIAQVAPLWARVPPATYGGTELVVSLLTEELVRRGHAVTLFAAGDSRTVATLRAVCSGSVTDAMAAEEAHEYVHYANALFAEALREASSFDVIHCHLGYPFLPVGLLTRTPVLHTVHTVPALDDLWVLGRYPEVAVAAVSRHQARAIPAGRRHEVRVVHHGIDFGAYDAANAPRKYLAFLGRMGPQKSPRDAIQVARAAGLPIVLAGRPQNADEELYFTRVIRPLIDGNSVRYAGPVNHAQKVELLRGAAALLFPIRGEEAFGLAMVEAMACGTPVVGYDTATVSEIVDPGMTGFIGRTPEELAGLVARALTLDRRAVREHARRRFSHTRMADDYVALYRELACKGPKSAGIPRREAACREDAV